MGPIRLLAAPIRSIVRFPLFQLAVVVAIILFLQAANDYTTFGQIFHTGLVAKQRYMVWVMRGRSTYALV
jgi:hypothetical protein